MMLDRTHVRGAIQRDAHRRSMKMASMPAASSARTCNALIAIPVSAPKTICHNHAVSITEIAGYCVIRQLGAGGMGQVFLVQHPRLPRQDALKLLDAGVSRNDDFKGRRTARDYPSCAATRRIFRSFSARSGPWLSRNGSRTPRRVAPCSRSPGPRSSASAKDSTSGPKSASPQGPCGLMPSRT